MPIDPQILIYIDRARVTGMSEEQIRQDLANAGWKPEDYDNLLKPGMPYVPQEVAGSRSALGALAANPKAKEAIAIIFTLAMLVGGYLAAAKYVFYTWPFGFPEYEAAIVEQSASPTPSAETSPNADNSAPYGTVPAQVPATPPKDANGWEKFSSAMYQFTIEYPARWTVSSGGVSFGTFELTLTGTDAKITVTAYDTKKVQAPEIPNSTEMRIGSIDCRIASKVENDTVAICKNETVRYKIQFGPTDDADIVKSLASFQLYDPNVKPRDSRRIGDLRMIQLAAELYFDNFNAYPAKTDDLVPSYLGGVPGDPLTNKAYRYSVSANHLHYHMGATLEEAENMGLTSDADFNSANAGGWTGGFNGSDDKPCSGGDKGESCYDVNT